MITPLARARDARPARARLVMLLACVAVMIALPAMTPLYLQGVLAKVWILGIFAMSLDLLVGYTGLLSLGHAAFLGVGGYALGLAIVRYGIEDFWLGIGIAVLAAAIVGALFGAIALRVRGAYFLLVTFALAELLVALAQKWSFLSPTGYGSQGVTGILRPIIFPMTAPLGSTGMYYLAAIALAVSYLAMRHFLRTPLGLTLPGVREQETRIRALGYRPTVPMYVVYVVAAAFAGLAGALLAYHDGIVTPGTFGVGQSTIVLLMVLIGGAGRLYGAVLGAAVVYLAEYYASTYFTDRWPLLLGAIFVAAVLFARGGIAGAVAAVWARWQRSAGRVLAPPVVPSASQPRETAPADAVAHTRPADPRPADTHPADPGPDPASALLSTRGLSRQFGGVAALDDVTLRVADGERLAIIGTNGAGKSTLFNLVGGTLTPTRGRIEFGGRDITDLPVHRRARLGIARSFQKNTLFGQLTVADSVWLACQGAASWRYDPLRTARRHDAAAAQVDRILEQWQLTDLRRRRSGQLAHGQQRRLEIALALASSPRLLLMDEPTAGQTQADSELLAARIRAMPRRVTVLVIAHDLDLVFTIADRIVVMHRGRIVATGAPAEIEADAAVQAIYTGLAPAGEDGS